MSKKGRRIKEGEIKGRGLYEVVDQPLIVFKKVKLSNVQYILKCKVPVGSTIVAVSGRKTSKYRSDKLEVISYRRLKEKEWSKGKLKFRSFHNRRIDGLLNPYFVGAKLQAILDKNLNYFCRSGLHFFLVERKAQRY